VTYARQFDVGSFTDPTKKPYKVSQRQDGGWECSCPAWTRHTPRKDCKHILRVKDAMRVAPASPVFSQAPTAAKVQQGKAAAEVVYDGYVIRQRREDADVLAEQTTFETVRRSRREL
jgi:hypothetical protein